MQFFLSVHYQVEQLIFLFSHQSLLNNMSPNHESVWQFWGWKGFLERCHLSTSPLPPHSLQLTNCFESLTVNLICHCILISQIEVPGGNWGIGGSLVDAFNITSGWGNVPRGWGKCSTRRSINKCWNARRSPEVVMILQSGFQGGWLRQTVTVISHWWGWG